MLWLVPPQPPGHTAASREAVGHRRGAQTSPARSLPVTPACCCCCLPPQRDARLPAAAAAAAGRAGGKIIQKSGRSALVCVSHPRAGGLAFNKAGLGYLNSLFNPPCRRECLLSSRESVEIDLESEQNSRRQAWWVELWLRRNSFTNVIAAANQIAYELTYLKYPLRILLLAAGRLATADARWATIRSAWRTSTTA